MLGRGVELRGQLQVPHELGAEHVRAPLVVSDRQRRGLVVSPRQVHLHMDGLAIATALAERIDHAPQHRGLLVHGDQAVGPRPDDARGLLRHRGAQERRCHEREAPDPRSIHADQPVMRDLLPAQQRTDHVNAFEEAGVTRRLRRPSIARHVFVQRLSRTECSPESAGEHRRQGRDRLSVHRGVVALSRRRHDAHR